MRAKRHALQWLVFLDCSLLVCSWLLYRRGSEIPAASLLGAAVLFIVWQIALFVRDSRRGTSFEVQKYVQRSHWIQAITQSLVYVYWSIYWDAVGHYALFIVAQISVCLFVRNRTGLDETQKGPHWLRAFSRSSSASISFSGLRTSTRICSLLLVAGAYLSKEFITWQRDGKK